MGLLKFYGGVSGFAQYIIKNRKQYLEKLVIPHRFRQNSQSGVSLPSPIVQVSHVAVHGNAVLVMRCCGLEQSENGSVIMSGRLLRVSDPCCQRLEFGLAVQDR